MTEISLFILDIIENSVKAKATQIEIRITESFDLLTFVITDNGCGIAKEKLNNVFDPFFTSRNSRNVGLGLPFLKLAAEQTGGTVEIVSRSNKDNEFLCGTTVNATFFKNSIDYTPLGNIISTLITAIQGNPNTDFVFFHTSPDFTVKLSTLEIKKILGEDIAINEFEILEWITGFLSNQYLTNNN